MVQAVSNNVERRGRVCSRLAWKAMQAATNDMFMLSAAAHEPGSGAELLAQLQHPLLP